MVLTKRMRYADLEGNDATASLSFASGGAHGGLYFSGSECGTVSLMKICEMAWCVTETSDEEQRPMKRTSTGGREKRERIHLDGYALKSKVELLNGSMWGTTKDARG